VVLIIGTILLSACGGVSDSPAPPAPNVLPTAAAGPDQVVDEQALVTLDGGASGDADGRIVSFDWAQLSGTAVSLTGATASSASFDAPALSIATTLSFELRVTDDRGGQSIDVVNVIVNPLLGLNQIPQADAGADRMAPELGSVLLDGSGSDDADGSIASFFWQQLSGPAVSLVNTTSARTSFTAPAAPATLEFELIVTDNEGAADASRVTVTVVPPAIVTLSGTVTFDLVPVSSRTFGGAFLDYGNTQAAPARNVTVEVIDASDGQTVLASGPTDDAGAYSLSILNFSDVFVRARAEMVQVGAPGWDVRVIDNTNGDALYVIRGADFNTGASSLTRDLHADSGWNGSGYSAPRAAAPLAILDAIYDAMALILSADPVAVFPSLDIHWSPSNRPVLGAGGVADIPMGEIGTSFYRSGRGGGIFLLGAENSDTEEYDRHVISHEWGHYLEAEFSRSDSIGGPHTTGDQLDMRVAFGEGWGNALSAMATGDTMYSDTLGAGQGQGFDFDVEGEARVNPGWYNEFSIHEILYDIFDAAQDLQQGTGVTDNVNLGFAPIFDVFVNVQRMNPVITSLFPFMNAIKARNASSVAAIDALLGVHDIEPIVDDYGSTENNAGNPASADVLPIYTQLTVNGGPVNVCSTDDFSSNFTGSINKLGSRRYLRFATVVAGNHTMTATTTSAPANEITDPDMVLHRAGPLWVSDDAPTAACVPGALGQCVESFSRPLPGGTEYFLEVHEWTNTNASDDPNNPPIGRACFDVEVTQP
jgi:hypothetical protein